MSNITGTVRAQLQTPANPLIYNIFVPVSNIETAQTLNLFTKTFLIRARGQSTMKVAFVAGDSALNYLTIPRGCNLFQDLVNFSGTIYFQTTLDNEVVEILEWT